jgi:hypothetical protein|tara:strand:- start:214 stop:537 length:324 start_codon:yes stop_codon:yes gene_type:complete
MENKMTDYDNSYLENKTLKEKVEKSTPLKEWLVDYVGNEFKSEMERINSDNPEEPLEWDDSVTVEMIIEVMSSEFPEFLMAIAEENFVRGYTQAMVDVYDTQPSAEE